MLMEIGERSGVAGSQMLAGLGSNPVSALISRVTLSKLINLLEPGVLTCQLGTARVYTLHIVGRLAQGALGERQRMSLP